MKAVISILVAMALGLTSLFADPERSDATTFEQLIQTARQAQVRRDFRGAAAAYREAVKLHSGIAELHANLGLMDHELGNHAEAIEEFLTALRLKPALFVPNYFLGLEYVQSNQPLEAIPYLQRASSADPNNEDAWYAIGIAYMDRAEQTGSTFAKLYRASPFFEALTAEYFMQQGKFADAIAEYRKFVSLQDAPPCSHSAFGFAFIAHRDPAAAATEFEADAKTSRCSAPATVGLARIEIENGDVSKALDLLAGVLKADQEFLKSNARRIWEQLPGDKTQTFERALSQPQPDADRARVAALLTAARNPTGLSNLEFTAPVRAAPPPKPNLQLVASSFFSGDYRTSSEAGERLLAERVRNPAVFYWTIKSDQQLASAAFARAEEIAPESPRIYLMLGDLYRRRGRYAEAEQEFEKVLTRQPRNLGAQLGLGASYYLDSRLDKAAAAAQRALDEHPADPEANLLMAEILIAQHRFDLVQPYLASMRSDNPDLIAQQHALRGRVYAATGRPAEAIAELKQVVDHDDDGSLNYVLARQYQKLGDQKSAAVAFERSRMLRSKADEAPKE